MEKKSTAHKGLTDKALVEKYEAGPINLEKTIKQTIGRRSQKPDDLKNNKVK